MQKNIVLLHGWGMNKAVWQLVNDALQSNPDLHVRALNLPGFGGANWERDSYTLTAAADELAQQLEDDSILVAWSMAGLFAIDIATRYPQKVAKIILVGSSPFFLGSAQWNGIKPDVLQQFMEALTTNPAKTVERFLAIQAMGSEHAKDDIKCLRTWLAQEASASPIALAGGLNLLKECDLRQQFAALQMPILGIFGRLDALVPVKVVDELYKLNPAFRAEILPKASHAPFISHREDFVSILKSML
ncbi:pimeloyl-ACP methyl ester esterase BioH [Pseudoalteromonas xiamenensis]|uniref:Pimeloyl-ACP methyl ester esterase BioH n=1 Tax=Pseudoalteromonas xiamenensis TaxID=882626 RepID=A0A975DFU5_9GAMM|nr:pimeloyl-ACP methyl ester esterase BioH [Pseudoalteromonas xiamenensis]QTH70490.1 pimeloyl-ACP methyl ester esterase BioH [Pseudoalteromonas xiamenensis]